MFDAASFFDDHGIPWTEKDSGRDGWINIQCPHCREGDTKFKLGIHPNGWSNCWRCGPHSLEDTVSKLLSVGFRRAKEVLAPYLRTAFVIRRDDDRPKVARVDPPGEPLRRRHQDYLDDRGFDPFWAEDEYGVLGTKKDERWNDLYFGNRIILPIKDRTGRIISFQGRDITGESDIRYKGCPIDLSVVHYKQTFYGMEHTRPDVIVVVEGIFDQWRLGRGSVASFGTSLTESQVVTLSEWPVVIFAFDSEEEAQAKARKYAAQVASFGRAVEVVDLELSDDRDMADLSELEASDVRRALGLA